jgi:protein O-GlcNAcase/histone acetyltransferase
VHTSSNQDNQGVCGYALAAADSKKFYESVVKDYLPRVQTAYTRPTGGARRLRLEVVFPFLFLFLFFSWQLASHARTFHIPGDQLEWTPSQHLVEEIFHPAYKLPDEVYRRFPSHVQIYTLVRARGQGNETRMLNAVLQFLSERKSDGVHVDVPSTNTRSIEQYERMGFRHVPVQKGRLGFAAIRLVFFF